MLFGEFIVRSQENLILIEMLLFLQCYFLFWQMLWNVNACALHRAWGMLKLMLATVYTQLRLSIWDVNFEKRFSYENQLWIILKWIILRNCKFDYISVRLSRKHAVKKGGEQKKRTM